MKFLSCARLLYTRGRLASERPDLPRILINHWPLRLELVRLPLIPRFALWCGTTATENWHIEHNARVCVSGHLHMRATDWRDGVRFEEVALGYPRHWVPTKPIEHYLREILPGPPAIPAGSWGPTWHR